MSLEAKNAWAGRFFVLPFVLGVIFFFARPLAESLVFTFSGVEIGVTGYETAFAGFTNLKVVLQEDANFTTNLVSGILQLLWQVPVILVLSLFFAILLNRKFRGRTLLRAIFFLPVIIASGVIIFIIRSDVVAGSAMSGDVVSGGVVSQSTVLGDMLIAAGLGEQAVNLITSISDNLFAMVWKTGFQMILFLAGLQSVPTALYEASSIEGATAWENFWKITFPMLSPILYMCMIYTIVDFFTDSNNRVMQQVLGSINQLKLGWAAAMAWSYFLLIALILAIVTFFYAKIRGREAE
jgi:ABC-type sugar transport system permease subunit